MKKKCTVLILWISFSALYSCQTEKQKVAEAIIKPNVIFILADDLGYGDLTSYNGQSKIPTPFIDALATEGIRFTDAHSPSAVCTPTRYGILTGEYCWRTPLKNGVLWTYDKPLISQDKYTLGKLFREAGYKTGMVGKWHLGWNWPLKEGSAFADVASYKKSDSIHIALEKDVDLGQRIGGGPTDVGFDYYFGVDVPNFPPYCFIENAHIVGDVPTIYKPDSVFGRYGLMQAGWQLNKVLPTLNRKAKSFVREHHKKNSGQPFFLYYSLTSPHTPIVPNEQFIGKSKAGDAGDFIVETDQYVGELIQVLKELGLYENTLIVFTSDNGSPTIAGNPKTRGKEWGKWGSTYELFAHNSNYPLRGMKADSWEGGHRIPLTVSWPLKIPKNKVNTQMVCLTDFFATFSEMLGVDLEEGNAIDSKSILTYLANKKTASAEPIRELLISHSIKGHFSIRKGDWKLIQGKNSGGFSFSSKLDAYVSPFEGQLYNLKEDLKEQNNLYEEYPEIVKELSAVLDSIKGLKLTD